MNEVFLDYSKYYDLLYKDKDYKAEANFIIDLIRKNHPSAQTILNLGCGTGQHDFFLADAGYRVTGIDLSLEMINIAKNKNTSSKCNFIHGDARNLKLGTKFDVVISLFHVLSYQTSNSDVSNFLNTVSSLLNDEGISILDYWYGPAVLTIKPEKRIKEFDSPEMNVTRKANTEINYVDNVATVNYDISITDKLADSVTEIQEKHHMRYFFSPELLLLTEGAQMNHIHQAEWMTKSCTPSEKTWAAYSILKK